MVFVQLPEYRYFSFLNKINRLVFVIELQCVSYTKCSDVSYTTHVKFKAQGVKFLLFAIST